MTLAEQMVRGLIVTVTLLRLDEGVMVRVYDPETMFSARARGDDGEVALEAACARLVKFKATNMRIV